MLFAKLLVFLHRQYRIKDEKVLFFTDSNSCILRQLQ